MFTVATFAFREYLEVFLIIAIFFSVTKKLYPQGLKKILTACTIGVGIALLLPILFFIGGSHIEKVITHDVQEIVEGILMVASSIFLAYVVLTLHSIFQRGRNKAIKDAHGKIEKKVMDTSLYLLIIFLIAREGLEIGVFTATVALTSTLITSLWGLALGFIAAAFIGTLVITVFTKLSFNKIFRYTEAIILLQGAALLQRGIAHLLEVWADFSLHSVLPLKLAFLPDGESLAGELIKGFTGITQTTGLLAFMIMALYIALYKVFEKRLSHAEA